MAWKFTIIDRNNVGVQVDEPTGWDSTEIKITRDLDRHGVFFDYSSNEFEFRGQAFNLLKAEYDSYKAKGVSTFLIEEVCNGVTEEFYRGRFLFTSFSDGCDDGDCYCKVPIEIIGNTMEIQNKFEQRVNLYDNKSFDGVTDLPAYPNLGYPMLLTPKGIFLQNNASNSVPEDFLLKLGEVPNIEYATGSAPIYNWAWFNIVPKLEDQKKSEFGNFNPSPTLNGSWICSGLYHDDHPQCPDLQEIFPGNFNTSSGSPYLRTTLFDWATNSPINFYDVTNPNNMDVIRRFNIEYDFSFKVTLSGFCNIMSWMNCLVKRRVDGTIEVIDRTIQKNGTGFGSVDPDDYWTAGSSHTFTYTKSIKDVTLEKGEYLYLVCTGLAVYLNSYADQNKDGFTLSQTSGTFDASTVSRAKETTAKVFLVNESLSRVAEAITNGAIRVYSTYFGRPDSLPYGTPSDGCGALEAITNGIHIRQQENRIDSNPSMPVSLADLWNGLDPIHHIGMGLEADPFRPGSQVLRVENWRHFYKPDIVLFLNGVSKWERSATADEYFGKFRFGYSKWEAEEFTGLDEFLTDRTYRNNIDSVRDTFEKLSSFLASGYAWETTRRKSNIDSKDWRYDNDLFISCLTRNRKFHLNFYNITFFDVPIGVIEIYYSGPLAPFELDNILIAGTQNNNTSFVVGNLFYDENAGIVTIFTPTDIVVEESFSASFPDIVFPPGFFIETGNIANPENIIDPDTAYNFRISPARNALRWMDKVLSNYSDYLDPESKIIFTDGKANVKAKGLLIDDSCRIEAEAIGESDTLNPNKAAIPEDLAPLLSPERIEFSFPMTVSEFKSLKANPYGMVYFRGSCVAVPGWIDEVVYKPFEKEASFKLIPAYGSNGVELAGIFNEVFNPAFQ